MRTAHDGYFVRVRPAGEPATSGNPRGPAPDPARGAHEEPQPSRRRHRRRFSVRPLPFLLVAVLGWIAWASTTDGGVSARVEDIVEMGQGVVDDATTDPNLKRAAIFYNARYARDGAYPKLTEEELRDDPDAGGFGIGVDIRWCSNESLVIQSYSAHGAMSRLLVQGKDLGDVQGDMPCPTDLGNPLPWKYKDEA